eukprot:TRINITY_DN55_c1_g1_i1.p1 TRINITY_DN55_c1_g1~~TRINITY_DN55_c1_g1_i1.p1  ORF type:complete len:705 (-),score=296.29 TRINITY_DN55_c1_g1_i1:201-2315(-)
MSDDEYGSEFMDDDEYDEDEDNFLTESQGMDDLEDENALLMDDHADNVFEVSYYVRPYICQSIEQIAQKQDEAIKQVAGVSNMPPGYARILLQSYKWETLRLLADYSEDPDKVCTHAGVPKLDQVLNVAPPKSLDEELTCVICYDDVKVSEGNALTCGHFFCGDCWKGFLSIEVKEKKKLIMCPGVTGKKKCSMVLDELSVLRMLKDKEAENRFIESMVTAFVEDNPSYVWCPTAGCKYAICLNESNSQHNEAVECICGNCFCFRCLKTDHRPATCKMTEEWAKKNGSDDEDMAMAFIATISRPCPNCKSPVQKNGGCNHMTCAKCNFHFCWMCMGKFGSGSMGGTDGYGNHKCNKFSEEDDTVLNQREEFKRFKFYSDRAINHVRSVKQDEKALKDEDRIASISGVMTEYKIRPQFYANALQRIIKNRRVLEASYCFGFFRPVYYPYVNKNIFEALQQDLEQNTERLAKMIEVGESENSIRAICDRYQEIVNTTGIAMKLSDSLLSAATDWTNTIVASSNASYRGPSRKNQLVENTDDINMDISANELSALEDRMVIENLKRQKEKAKEEAKNKKAEPKKEEPKKEEPKKAEPKKKNSTVSSPPPKKPGLLSRITGRGKKNQQLEIPDEEEESEEEENEGPVFLEQQQTNFRGTRSNWKETSAEDSDVQKAIKASLTSLDSSTPVNDEEEELQRAIAASLMEH